MSHLKKRELLIFGYIKESAKSLIIPKELILICLMFYPKIEIVIDVYHDTLSKFVSNDNLSINIDNDPYSYMSFGSSIGWRKGIHYYTLQKRGGSSYIGIGIVSDINIVKNKNHYILYTRVDHSNKNFVGYCLDGNGNIYKMKVESTTSYCNYEYICKADGWNTNDSMTIMVDCDNWKMRYYKKSKQIGGNIDIEPNITYYAAFTAYSSYMNIKLIETDVDILSKQ